MSLTHDEIDRFAEFGHAQLSSAAVASLDELLVAWDSHCRRDEINAAIREGIADADAGRVQPAREAIAQLRQKFGLQES